MTDITVEIPMEYRHELESCFEEMERLGELTRADRTAIARLREQSATLRNETRALHEEVEHLAAEGKQLKAVADEALERLAGIV